MASSSAAKPVCIVCFDGTTQIDQSLPPPCYKYLCDASVCLPCLQKILASSTLFKAPICPTCGSNMNSKDLKDTILLRRYKHVKQNHKLPDSELGAGELRERKAFAKGSELEREVKELVETRRAGEFAKMSSIREYLMKKQDSSNSENTDAGDDGRQPMKFPVDESFFQGRSDYSAMTDEEKCYVSNLLTSGDPDQLAQAAQILMGISNMHAASNNTTNSSSSSSSSSQKQTTSTPTPPPPPSEKEAMAIRAMAIADKNPKERHKLQKLEKIKAQHPLPKHMPKCISLSAKEFGDPFNKRACLIRFKDNENGQNNNVVQNNKRVFVKLARGKASNKSLLHDVIIKGDVVTHVNGEVFQGNKNDLRSLIQRIQRDCEEEGEEGDASGEFTMIFNANEATAQALREREICLITRSLGLLEV